MTDGWIKLRNRMRLIPQSYLTVDFDSRGWRRLLLVQPGATKPEGRLLLRWLQPDAVTSNPTTGATARGAPGPPPSVKASAGTSGGQSATQLFDADTDRVDLRTLASKLTKASGISISPDEALAPHA